MAETYTNPVYPHSFPDPFVLKWCGEYWAYCTGTWRDGRCFGILRSRDLVAWSEVGGAMQPLPGDLPHYWAPEVSMIGGRFFMYYSAGVELEDMAIRVAVADHPAGPFEDAGVRLTDVPFAIDAHVFTDDDGTRYLFYATDYLEHTHVGTGTAVVQLRNPLAIAGESYPVTRARYDWQVYDPQRREKGGVRWHTVEGSYVLKRKGRYYQMFSAGNWQNPSYGVSYATSDTILRPDEWDQHADGRDILPILRTIPGRVVGPGHNSAVR
ncbi:MAG TPA: glycoside hydrolase family 43 protein, partial [Roseiflexaceae bacterium]|nr:glycoside hydrolase family 43 protein [Roseiflexaceae bacterium]